MNSGAYHLRTFGKSESEVAQSCPTLCDPWTVAHKAPLSMGFSRQEYRSGLPFPPPGHLPNPGIELTSPALAGRFFTTEPPLYYLKHPGQPVGLRQPF